MNHSVYELLTSLWNTGTYHPFELPVHIIPLIISNWVATNLENLEKSANFTLVSEKSGKLGKVMEMSGKLWFACGVLSLLR